MRKRFYILFVTRGEDGQLRKIPIPIHYLYVFIAGAAVGLFGLGEILSTPSKTVTGTSKSFNRR